MERRPKKLGSALAIVAIGVALAGIVVLGTALGWTTGVLAAAIFGLLGVLIWLPVK